MLGIIMPVLVTVIKRPVKSREICYIPYVPLRVDPSRYYRVSYRLFYLETEQLKGTIFTHDPNRETTRAAGAYLSDGDPRQREPSSSHQSSLGTPHFPGELGWGRVRERVREWAQEQARELG